MINADMSKAATERIETTTDLEHAATGIDIAIEAAPENIGIDHVLSTTGSSWIDPSKLKGISFQTRS